MGMIRGGSVFVFCLLLLISLFLMESFYVLGTSLQYNNVESGISGVLQNLSTSNNIISKEIIGDFNVTKAALDASAQLQRYCQNNTDYVFSYENYTVTIPCTAGITANPQAIINKTISDITHDVYYANYNCSFFDCFSKTKLPFFLVSEKTMDYMMNKFYFFFAVSLALLLLIFLLAEEKQDVPIIAGVLIIISAFPILKLKDLVDFIAGKFSPVIDIFLGSTGSVFTTFLIIGIVLIALGIAWKVFGRNTIKKKLSVNDVKGIVKEEMEEEKAKGQRQQQKQQKPRKEKSQKKKK